MSALIDKLTEDEDTKKVLEFRLLTGDTPTELLVKTVEKLERDLASAKAEIEELHRQLIYGFYEEDAPFYMQGDQASEICGLATADEINGLVRTIGGLRKALVRIGELIEQEWLTPESELVRDELAALLKTEGT